MKDLYFAYGSNLCWRQMKERCKDSKFVCRARLSDFRLAFTRYSSTRRSGVADIRRDPGEHVWGVIYEVSEEDLDALNRFEGYRGPGKDNAYGQLRVRVAKEGVGEEWVLTYQVAKPAKDHIQPSRYYLQLIIEGAKRWHLPLEYRQRLERFMSDQL